MYKLFIHVVGLIVALCAALIVVTLTILFCSWLLQKAKKYLHDNPGEPR